MSRRETRAGIKKVEIRGSLRKVVSLCVVFCTECNLIFRNKLNFTNGVMSAGIILQFNCQKLSINLVSDNL